MAAKNEDRILASAARVFQRYGFRKTTMGDLAEAAQMSRPALYLVYPSKVEVFAAAVAQVFAALLDEVRDAMAGSSRPAEQLRRGFEIWCVRQFEKGRAAPDTADLLESSTLYAPEATAQAFAGFNTMVAETLRPLLGKPLGSGTSADQLAEMMCSAALGFKATAQNVVQLRSLIECLITVVLTSLSNEA